MNAVLVSAKHSPGVTTVALALASALAEGHDDGCPVLFEADLAGGDLAPRLGLPFDPGLGSLAASVRHSVEAGVVWRHANALPGGGAVVLAPTDPAQCRSAVASLAPRLGALAETELVDGVVDGGRLLDLEFSAGQILRAGSLTLVVSRTDLAGIEHTARLVRRLRAHEAARPVVAVTIGDRPYGPQDVAAVTDGTPAWSIPWDPSGAASLVVGSARRARRTPLVRAARSIADQIWTGVAA